MIHDHIVNANLYKGISSRLDKGLDFLQNSDLDSIEVGKYPIDGDNVFVLIQEYEGKNLENANCEAHKRYIDIQYIISGDEYIGYAPVEGMEVIEEYSAEKDRFFVKWEGALIPHSEGAFSIFFPQDAHMPGVVLRPGVRIKKAVVKIKI